MQIVDSHVHFVGDPGSVLEWADPSDAQLNRRRLASELRAEAAPHQIAGAIAIEADPEAAHLDALCALGAADPLVIGVVANLRPGVAGFAQRLADAAARPLVRGLRVGTPWAPIALDDPAFVADLSAAAERGLALDVVTVGGGGLALLEAALALAQHVPDLRVVLDHLPFFVGEDPANWAIYRSRLRTLAAKPQVYAKLSNLLPRSGPVPTDPAHYQPLIDELFALFGDRLMYGSNWPVSLRVAPYPDALEVLLSCVERVGSGVPDRFFRQNVQAAYRLAR
jgi:predicted TIM-barrel fold metal-dependent hydrolase